MIGFLGASHLGQTLKAAAVARGMETCWGCYKYDDLSACNLVFVTQDVDDHADLNKVRSYMQMAVTLDGDIPVVLVSQVPPGFTRPWITMHPNLYYQVDTIIMNCALQRATYPERFIVGCEWPSDDLPSAYLTYLGAFNCPVVKMGIESAELCKLAINYYLAKQIETTNDLASVANNIGADWDEIIPGLRLDKRIGEHAYIQPGPVGGHLPRDVKTIEKLKAEYANA